ncbi:DUF3093 domain-containing protein [Marisediminicola senii]|uniref:DUF3093 domain-containing protein n=1 Tax=Marisediminicola senii TaxID=2711233 RepID=UPI0013EB80BE|nr:DUF3093 domain-containing protein [Marisediminicola senii]
MQQPAPEPLYRERLWPSLAVVLPTVLVIPASLLVFLPINIAVGWITAVVFFVGINTLLIATAPVIMVDRTHLTAGRARLPLELAGTPTGFTGVDATAQRGPQLDARAWLVIRGWIGPVVKVPVTDESDPAPYWLISTRRPAAVADAIATAKTAGSR